jgi:MFS transporter, DHA3 family, macrolide efflux protein
MSRLKVFKNRHFNYFFLATLVGLLGEGMFTLATLVIMTKTTGSVIAIGYMLILQLTPSLFLSPFAGVLIDRINNANIAIWCNLLRFLCIGALPLLTYLGAFSMPLFYLSVFLNYIAWYILAPTTESMLKKILKEDEYVYGVSLTESAWQVGLLSAALFAGLFMKMWGVDVTLIITAATYLLGVALFMPLKKVYADRPQVASLSLTAYFNDMKEGWDYLVNHKKMFYFSLASAISLPYLMTMNVLISPFNYNLINGNELTLGVIDSAAGIGSLISAAICIILANSKRLPGLLLGSILFTALSTYLFSASPNTLWAFFYYLLLGLFVGNTKVLSKSLVFTYVHPDYVGRTMTAISMLSLLLAIVSCWAVSYIGEIDLKLAYYALAGTLVFPLICTWLGKRRVESDSLVHTQQRKAVSND